MNLVSFLFRIFSKKTEISSALIDPTTRIPLPKRSDFEEVEHIKKIDGYKTNYLQILSQKCTILSTHLESGDFRKKVTMYVSLIRNLICGEDKSDFESIVYYHDGNKRIESICKLGKLKLYSLSIDNLEQELAFRLVALMEILEESPHLFPSKKNALRQEIKHLCLTRVDITTQKTAIGLETMAYLNEYTTTPHQEFVSKEVEKKLIHNKCEELRHMLHENLEKTNDVSLQEDSISNMILMEEMLEKYFYEQKEEKNKIQMILNSISVSIACGDDSTIKDVVFGLESKLKAGFLYGDDIVSREMLMEYYSMKFMVIEHLILNDKNFEIHDVKTGELSCYNEILTRMIEEILKGNNPIFNSFSNSQFDLSCKIKNFIAICKDNTNTFSPLQILMDKKRLGLIFAFQEENGLEKYFSNTMVSTSNYNLSLFLPGIFRFQEKVPLDTVYRMKRYNCAHSGNLVIDFLNPFFREMCEKRKQMGNQDEEEVFCFPEGLTEINVREYDLCQNDVMTKILDLDVSNKQIKVLTFPPTLKTCRGLDCTQFDKVFFNEGLTTLENPSFKTTSEVHIPPSLTHFFDSNGSHWWYLPDTIYFENYKHSMLREEGKVNLIQSLFVIQITNCHPANYYGNVYSFIGQVQENAKVMIEPRRSKISFCDGEDTMIPILRFCMEGTVRTCILKDYIHEELKKKDSDIPSEVVLRPTYCYAVLEKLEDSIREEEKKKSKEKIRRKSKI